MGEGMSGKDRVGGQSKEVSCCKEYITILK